MSDRLCLFRVCTYACTFLLHVCHFMLSSVCHFIALGTSTRIGFILRIPNQNLGPCDYIWDHSESTTDVN